MAHNKILMEQNELEYQKFTKWLTENNHVGFTSSEAEFAKQMFEILEDYPSLKNKIVALGSKAEVFNKIQWFLKEKNK